MSNTLFLRLEGPMQSWGERSRWNVRDSAPEPTKSGVIGLIGCAMGYSDDQSLRDLSLRTRMAVRVDEPGTRLTDFHTVGGGYDYPAMLTSDGRMRDNPEITYRDYLCGASFLVALQLHNDSDLSLIAQMAEKLQGPIWAIYLGRKSCPPSRPVFDGVGTYPNLITALEAGKWSEHVFIPPWRRQFRIRGVVEGNPAEHPHAVRRRDHLYSRSYRIYHPRYTYDRIFEVSMSDNEEIAVSIMEETSL